MSAPDFRRLNGRVLRLTLDDGTEVVARLVSVSEGALGLREPDSVRVARPGSVEASRVTSAEVVEPAPTRAGRLTRWLVRRR